VPVYLDVKAPVFTGWILVVVAKLITNVRLVRETLARDYRLGLWRQYKDITEEPTTLAIHKSYIGKPEDAEFNNVSLYDIIK
jgi:hypothetical protein